MDGETITSYDQSTANCVWCAKDDNMESGEEVVVCDNCLRLMSNAGLLTNEILAGPHQGQFVDRQ